MSSVRVMALVSLAAVVLAACPGCGQKSTGPKTYPVKGTVTFKGKSVEGATVTFRGADGKSTAVGTTNASGQYTLNAGPAGPGALAGQYQVVIVKFKTAETAAASKSGEYVPPAPNQPPPPPPQNELPAKYADPKTSELKAEVKEGAATTFDFKLE